MYQNLLPLWRTNEELMITAWEGLGFTNNYNLRRNTYVKGSRHYELSNHTSTLLSAGLGNVLTVVSDRKIEHDERYAFAQGGGYKYENGAYHLDAAGSFAQLSASDGIISHYTAELISATDYYAFGAPLPERSWQGGEYRFGFNGVLKDDEIYGIGNAYSFEYRVHDTRLGRFLSVDPLEKEYPWNSTYAFAENRVIDGKDLEGLEYVNANGQAAGPLNAEYAKSTGAELEPQFQNNPVGSDGMKTVNLPEVTISAKDPAKEKAEIAAAQAKQQQIVTTFGVQGPVNNSTIRAYNILDYRSDIAMNLQIAQGVKIGLESEMIGIGASKMFSQIGKINVPIYRTFGGASNPTGSYWTFVNPRWYGKNYAKYAGLPEFNSSAFAVKYTTQLKNLKFSSIKMAMPMHGNKGGWVPEIQIIRQDNLIFKEFSTTSYSNPNFNPYWMYNNYGFPLKH